MLIRTGFICFVFSLPIFAVGCGSSVDDTAGAAGAAGTGATAGSANAGGSSAAGGGVGGVGGGSHSTGGVNGAGSSGAAGQTSMAGHAGSGGNSGLGGHGGSGSGTAGAANGGGPASTEGLAFSGSCLYPDHCTDEWDVTFGADVLQQLCTGQQGTWSTGHCATTAWKKKCTQAVFGGVYVQYLPADGICAAGFEEQL